MNRNYIKEVHLFSNLIFQQRSSSNYINKFDLMLSCAKCTYMQIKSKSQIYYEFSNTYHADSKFKITDI